MVEDSLNATIIVTLAIENPEFVTPILDGLTERDIASGRGAPVNKHAGNRNFRQFVMDNQHLYRGLPEGSRRGLAEVLVRTIYDHGGRFMKEQEGLWVEASFGEATEKTQTLLRQYSRNP